MAQSLSAMNHEYKSDGVNIDKISIGVPRTPTEQQQVALLGGRYRHCEHRLTMQDDNSLPPLPSLSPSLLLRKAAERGTELWGNVGS